MISETTPAIELPQRFSDQTRRSSKPEVISIIKKDPVSIKSIGNAKMMNSLEENISRAKNLPWKLFFRGVLFFFKHICAMCFLIILIQFQMMGNQALNCNLDSSNFFMVCYVVSRIMVFTLAFYLLIFYYLEKTCVKHSTFKILIGYYCIAVFLLFMKIYQVIHIGNAIFLYIHAANVSLFLVKILAFYLTKLMTLQHLKKIIFFMLLICFCFIFNYYGMKIIIIPIVKEKTTEIRYKVSGNIIFQIFLFVYFMIYRKIFIFTLVKSLKFSQFNEEDKDLAMFLTKYYLMDAVCSAIPAAVSEKLSSAESWFGIFNFLYQVLVLYDQNFNVFQGLKTFLYKIMKIVKTTCNQEENEVKEMMRTALNQIVIIVYLHLCVMYIWRRCLYFSVITTTCDFLIAEYVEIRLENIFLLAFFNFLLALAVMIRKKDTLKPIRSLAASKYIFQIYYMILLHYVFDDCISFYFQFYYLKNH